jgi:hypothetical protein
MTYIDTNDLLVMLGIYMSLVDLTQKICGASSRNESGSLSTIPIYRDDVEILDQ